MTCTLEKQSNVLDEKSKKTIKKALKALGKKNLAFIMHNGSFPAAANQNTGFGSINSEAGKEFIEYASGLFDAIQLGPAGKTKGCDSSPYTGTIFSDNPLFIDLKQLTTKAWNKILSEDTYNQIVNENPNKDTNKTAYSYIYKKQNEALQEAWNNFKANPVKKLEKEFKQFKSENSFWLDKDSLYEALSIEHGNDYWPLWNSETDKNLFNPESIEQRMEFAKRIEEIEKILKNAEVVVEDEVDSDKINIGCKVDVLDLEYDEEIEFQIVGSTEANSLEGKISNESPVGKALIGAHKDDIVDVETPAGIMQYKVLSIQRNI